MDSFVLDVRDVTRCCTRYIILVWKSLEQNRFTIKIQPPSALLLSISLADQPWLVLEPIQPAVKGCRPELEESYLALAK